MKIFKSKLVLFFLIMVFTSTSLYAKAIYDKMLYKAIIHNDINKINLYLGKGANINSFPSKYLGSIELKTMKYLIKKGYHISDNGERCLLSDIMQDRNRKNDTYEVVKFLINNGAKPSCKDNDEFYHKSVIESFMYNGAKYASDSTIKAFELIVKNAKNDLNYHKPLYHAFHNGTDSRSKIIKVLVRNGANINEEYTSDRYSHYTKHRALELAIKYCLPDIVKFLIKNGANINQVTEGKSPVDVAHEREYDKIELFLVEHGAKYHKYSDLN